MAKKKKYNFGGTIPTPGSALQKNNIAWANAMQKADSGLTQALDIGGGLAQMVGSSLMSQGAATKGADAGDSKFLKTLTDNGDGIASMSNMLPGLMQMFAYGGVANGVPIEVEGNEVAETPDGEIAQFIGPTHEQGGIGVNVPEGTDIYSDRITVDGMTMAQRKKLRKNRENKASKGKDPLSKSTAKRVAETNAVQEEHDKNVQQQVAAELDKEDKKYANGSGIFGVVDDPTDMSSFYRKFQTPAISNNDVNKAFQMQRGNPSSTNIPTIIPPGNTGGTDSDKKGFDFGSLLGNFTAGDALGMFGNFFQAKEAKNTVLENRATDTPNINAFEHYGKKGLESANKAKQFLLQDKESQIANLDKQRVTASSRNRKGARGINTMRALDIATDNSINQAQTTIQDNFAKAMMNAVLGEAQLQNQQDNTVMQGEQARDLADRQDKDNFYTQLGKAQTQYGEMLSKTGKNINQKKTDKTTEELLNQMYDFVGFDPTSGKITAKDSPNLVGKDSDTQLSNFVKSKGYEKLGLTKKEWDSLTKEEQIAQLLK